VIAEIVNLCWQIAGGQRGEPGLMAREGAERTFDDRLLNVHGRAVIGVLIAMIDLHFVQTEGREDKESPRTGGVVLVIHHHDAVAAGDIEQFNALMPVVVNRTGGVHAVKRNGLPIERNAFQ
jgi:hypothetical protein